MCLNPLIQACEFIGLLEELQKHTDCFRFSGPSTRTCRSSFSPLAAFSQGSASAVHCGYRAAPVAPESERPDVTRSSCRDLVKLVSLF